MLDRILRIGLLFDFYGALLTEKQQRCLEMHYLNDLSLAEIAEQFAVSRQAIYDILRRAELTLEEYEQKLGLVQRHQGEQHTIQQVYNLIDELPEGVRANTKVQLALEKLASMLDTSEEV